VAPAVRIVNPAKHFMGDFFGQLWRTLRPGTLLLICTTSSLGLLSMFGGKMGLFSLPHLFAVGPDAFWQGKVWVLVTHAFLPVGIFDLVMNGLMLIMIGHWLERYWSKWELWSFCLIVAAGPGVAKLLLAPIDRIAIYGTLTLSLGLLAALYRLSGDERVLFMGVVEVTMKQFVAIAAILDVILLFSMCGMPWTSSLADLMAWPTGWYYLSLRWKVAMRGSSRKIESTRTRRLEL
jgi:membrane associated rhomboid family serine protease